MKVEGIGFDYGNTLVLDPFERVVELKAFEFVRIMERNKYEVSKKRLLDAWKKINETMNYKFCSHFAQEVPLIETVLEKIGVHKRDRSKIAQQLLVAYRAGLKQELKNDKKIDKTKEVLSELKNKGKRLIVMSNERVDTLKMQLSWTGLDRFFEKVVTSEGLGLEKPDKRIFRHLANTFGLSDENILYVGDDPERDIKPSKDMGMKAVLVKHSSEMSVKGWRDYDFKLSENQKPDFVISDLKELISIVE
ncbi:MAG: HAD family hydrolase [Candidatus Aenigmarchaeota archaeon]|nr:HAD family hydrolase [Candidatus Aenigmarchaeota archaeon]